MAHEDVETGINDSSFSSASRADTDVALVLLFVVLLELLLLLLLLLMLPGCRGSIEDSLFR